MSYRQDSKFWKFDNGLGLVLNIGIVGAGIAGLTAAATLSRLGHHVDVSLGRQSIKSVYIYLFFNILYTGVRAFQLC